MGNWADNMMNQVERGIKQQVKERLEDAIKPFQSEIEKEGATVRLIENQSMEQQFTLSIKDASEDLTARIRKAIGN